MIHFFLSLVYDWLLADKNRQSDLARTYIAQIDFGLLAQMCQRSFWNADIGTSITNANATVTIANTQSA